MLTSLPITSARVLDLRASDGVESVFSELPEPDEATAYIEFEICKSLPNMLGPTMAGDYHVFHPAVLARSFQGFLHKPANLHHSMKAYGSRVDRVVGMVVGVYFPEEPDGGWDLENLESAPSIRAVAAVAKNAHGVAKVLGEHLSGKQKWSVSIETTGDGDGLHLFHSGTKEFLPIEAAMKRKAWKAAIGRDENGYLKLGQVGGSQLAFGIGGVDGTLKYNGFAFTPNPAESTASLTSVFASREVNQVKLPEGGLAHLLASAPKFYPGMDVEWAAGSRSSKGTVVGVYEKGLRKNSVRSVTASVEDPALEIVKDGVPFRYLLKASELAA